MSIVSSGEYKATPTTYTTNRVIKHQMDPTGNLFVRTRPQFRETNNLVAGALSTTGKIGTVAAAATINVVVACDSFPVEKVLWTIQSDKAFTYTLAVNNSNPLGGTLTLTDATAVDDGDTFTMNGLTFTAEATEADASAATRKWYHPSQAVGAVNLAALLSDATYGVPGVTASASAVSATDVITIAATTATALQFGQGTSATDEVAWASTTQASLIRQGGVVSKAANSTWLGDQVEQYVDGYGYAALQLTNADASNAATFVVRAVRL